MDDLQIAEERVVHESPVHGAELLAELKSLRAHVQDITAKWAADDHEARMLRFALADIEHAAKAEGREAIAHMANTARLNYGLEATKVKAIIDAATIALEEEFPEASDGGTGDLLRSALAPFLAVK